MIDLLPDRVITFQGQIPFNSLQLLVNAALDANLVAEVKDAVEMMDNSQITAQTVQLVLKHGYATLA